jgi:hypothetical protein
MATKVKTGVIDSSAITSALIANASITADDLHTTLDLTGKTVTVATASAGDNDTSVASTAFVSTAIANLADSAPSTLNTLNELAAALGDDANYATTTTNAIAAKAPLASPSLTGTVTVTGASSAYNTLQLTSNSTGHGTVINLGDTSDADYGSITQFASSSGEGGRMRFIAGTTETMNLRGGKVGIGTNDPQSIFHINGANPDLRITTSGDNEVARLTLTEDALGTTHGAYFQYEGDDGDKTVLGVTNYGTDTDVITYTDTGNVGIGETSPSAPLDIAATSAGIELQTTDNTSYGYLNFGDPQDNNIGQILYDHASNYMRFQVNNTEKVRIDSSGRVGIGTSDPKSTLQLEGGRMGIISTDSSWEQLRVANSSVAEAGIAIMNGCTASEFLADNSPSFSNAFTLAINPYGAGTDTLAIGHGNLTDSIWHIDGSGNFGYGPNTENPASYYEISKNRPNVNQPSDYELKMTLNTYGYVGSGYKLGMLQFLGGDTAGAQDNFYAGIGSTALDGVNNSEEGSLDFHVRNGISTTETLAMQIVGKAGTGIAGGGQHGKSVLFRYPGVAIDRVWADYPGISVFNSSDAGTNQGEFRFHGCNSSSAAYPSTSGSDFSVDVRADGSFISTSDRRAKTNITTIDNALSKVNQLTGKRFQRINRENQPQEHISKNGYKFGFIAQEIEDIIPEAVKYHANEDDGTENWNSSYAMDYGSVVALLVNAIKEQDVVIQDLKTRITTLEG